MRPVAGEIVRFCIVGASGFVVNLGVFQAALRVGADHRGAAALAFLTAVASNYALNRRWTFAGASATAKRAQAPRFLAVSLAGFAVGLGVLEALVGTADVPLVAAQACAIVVATPVSFAGQKLWSFARPVARGVEARA